MCRAGSRPASGPEPDLAAPARKPPAPPAEERAPALPCPSPCSFLLEIAIDERLHGETRGDRVRGAPLAHCAGRQRFHVDDPREPRKTVEEQRQLVIARFGLNAD